MDKNNNEVIRMLNAYNKDAKEGDLWYGGTEEVIAAYNGKEWVSSEPLTLTDLKDVSFPEEEDQLLLYDASDLSHPILTLEVDDENTTGLKAGEGLQIKVIEPPTTFCIYNPNGDLMVNIDIETGNVEFG